MNCYLCFLLFSSICISSLSARNRYQRTVRYDGEILVRCPVNAPGVKDLLQNDYVDVWQIYADGMADIRLDKDILQSASFIDAKAECTKIADVEALVQRAENITFPRKQQAEWFEEYHTYDEIVNWYKELCQRYSSICSYILSIGESIEGRDQPAVHISGSSRSEVKIYFQCQIHAREWISGATCMYIANYLLESYGRDNRVTTLLDQVEIIFVPFVNPDGYVYTWNGDRLWRKNRRINSGSTCRGVDLNRNYPDHWGEGGSSSNPCSETYMGSSEESEPETRNTINYFKGNGPIIGAVDWHSFSQLILRPYGWTRADCPDETKLRQLGDDMRDAIRSVHGMVYTSQKSIDLYPTTGTASDWFYSDDAAENNVGYRAAGYTIELRDTGRYGFNLPPDQIIPTGEEMIPAVMLFAERLLEDPIPI